MRGGGVYERGTTRKGPQGHGRSLPSVHPKVEPRSSQMTPKVAQMVPELKMCVCVCVCFQAVDP